MKLPISWQILWWLSVSKTWKLPISWQILRCLSVALFLSKTWTDPTMLVCGPILSKTWKLPISWQILWYLSVSKTWRLLISWQILRCLSVSKTWKFKVTADRHLIRISVHDVELKLNSSCLQFISTSLEIAELVFEISPSLDFQTCAFKFMILFEMTLKWLWGGLNPEVYFLSEQKLCDKKLPILRQRWRFSW